MQIFHFLYARSSRMLVLAVVFGFAGGALNSGLLAVINAATSQHARDASLVAAFVVLCALAPLARIISELLLVRAGQNAVLSMRTKLSGEAMRVPLRHLEEVGPHRILSVLTDDIPSITNMVGAVPILCVNLGVVASCLLYMGWLDWRMLAAVLGIMALGIVSYQVGVSRAMQHFRRAREHENQMQKHFQGLVHGVKELKLHRDRRNAFLVKHLRETAEASRTQNVAALTIYATAASWGQLLVFVVLGLIVFVVAGALGVASGIVTGFAFALLYMTAPLQVIMNSVPMLARANIALNNVRELGLTLERSVEAEEEANAPTRPCPAAQLKLSNVSYSYKHADSPGEFKLGPLNLSISPGELLFITGGNGSGKTTLAKLIMGLYTPQNGQIFYNGDPVRDDNRDDYRQLFSAVFSDFFLFESLLGLDGSQLDERARQYLVSLRLDHKVSVKDGVLSTTDLSQGQRKRLALLTCCLEDRPVCFFDEWAADQDPTFKEIFYLSILPELKAAGKTVIVISHDDRYFGVADRIVNLESGQLNTGVPAFLSQSLPVASN